MKKTLALLGLFLAGCGSEARAEMHSIFPPNDLGSQDCLTCESAGGITEAQFNQVGAEVKKQFTPIFTKMGETFTVELAWKEKDVNAWANRVGKKSTVHFIGGLARRPEIGVEGFMLVASHEVAHLLAYKFKKPQVYVDAARHMTVENASDSVGSEVFMRNLIEKTPLAPKYFDINAKCAERFAKEIDQNTCSIQLAAGLQLGELLAVLNQDPVPDYDHLDTTVVTKTNMTYGSTVCRLTNFFWGAMRYDSYSSCWFKN